VNADGSGQYVSGDETVQVNADGSGQWVGAMGTVTNAGDGSGQWVGDGGILVNKGDGSGTYNDRPVSLDPLPKVAPLGRFPMLAKLKPVGRACGTLIRIGAEVLFDFDKDTLRPQGASVLRAVAKALGDTSAAVSVNGHTDAKGTDSYNLDLSERRARAVVKALQDDGLGAPMTPHGFGETQPVAPNTLKGKDNPAGRQLNRRVELVVGG
jgi:OOP family OmpA-OmpF porin